MDERIRYILSGNYQKFAEEGESNSIFSIFKIPELKDEKSWNDFIISLTEKLDIHCPSIDNVIEDKYYIKKD